MGLASALLLAACSSAPASSGAKPASTPSARATPLPTSSPAAATPVSVSIDLGGTPAATSAQLIVGCQRTPAGYGAQFQLTVGGAPYVLSIEIVDYHGPGVYSIPPERVSLRPSAAGQPPSLEPATGGSVRIDAGERSGSVDVTVQGDHATPLRGTWRCT